jgi:mRNA interferase MazF
VTASLETQPPAPDRGEVWFVDLDPSVGHEQAMKRWAVAVSDDVFNHGPAELVTIVPITTTLRALRMRVRLDPPEGGLTHRSDIIVEQVRTISRRRLIRTSGRVSSKTMAEIEDRLRLLLVL